MFTQGYRVTGKLELWHLFCFVKLQEAAQLFVIVHYVREMTAKKSCMVNMDRLSICSSCFCFCFCFVLFLFFVFLFVCLFVCFSCLCFFFMSFFLISLTTPCRLSHRTYLAFCLRIWYFLGLLLSNSILPSLHPPSLSLPPLPSLSLSLSLSLSPPPPSPLSAHPSPSICLSICLLDVVPARAYRSLSWCLATCTKFYPSLTPFPPSLSLPPPSPALSLSLHTHLPPLTCLSICLWDDVPAYETSSAALPHSSFSTETLLKGQAAEVWNCSHKLNPFDLGITLFADAVQTSPVPTVGPVRWRRQGLSMCVIGP